MRSQCASPPRVELSSLTSCLTLLFPDAISKLKELVENILESLDTLPHPLPPNHLAFHPFFSRVSTSTSDARPLLNAVTLKKLTRLLGTVTKKVTQSSSLVATREQPLWWGSALEEGDPGRLMELLRGSLEEGKEVRSAEDVWGASTGTPTKEVKEQRAKKAVSKSPEKAKVEEGGDVETKAEDGVDEAPGLESLEELLEVALEAALATDCCLVMLSSKGVPANVSLTRRDLDPSSASR